MRPFGTDPFTSSLTVTGFVHVHNGHSFGSMLRLENRWEQMTLKRSRWDTVHSNREEANTTFHTNSRFRCQAVSDIPNITKASLEQVMKTLYLFLEY